MPAHVRTEHGLAVAFHRDRQEVDREVTATGELAVLAGVAMLIRQKALQDGDRLDVTEVRAAS
jgi:hypothetical protein